LAFNQRKECLCENVGQYHKGNTMTGCFWQVKNTANGKNTLRLGRPELGDQTAAPTLVAGLIEDRGEMI
jgi:hypothetical protein